MKLFLLTMPTLFIALSAQAQECPTFRLECEVITFRTGGGYSVTDRGVALLEDHNADGPALPPTECRASVILPSVNKEVALHATVVRSVGNGDFTAFLYAFERHGVVGNHASMEIKQGQRFSLRVGPQELRCELIQSGTRD